MIQNRSKLTHLYNSDTRNASNSDADGDDDDDDDEIIGN